MADSKKPRRPPWDYRTEEYPMTAEMPLGMWLSGHGREGWELVQLIHHQSGNHLYTAVFKRPGIAALPKPKRKRK